MKTFFKKSHLIVFSLIIFNQTSWGQIKTPIENPILLMNGGTAKKCLENQLLHALGPQTAHSVSEWKGPGQKADSTGAIDKQMAAYVLKTEPNKQWYALLLLSNDDSGWGLFTYKENGALRIGFRAKSVERTAWIAGVNPREGFQKINKQIIQTMDEEFLEIDLSPCENLLKSKPNQD